MSYYLVFRALDFHMFRRLFWPNVESQHKGEAKRHHPCPYPAKLMPVPLDQVPHLLHPHLNLGRCCKYPGTLMHLAFQLNSKHVDMILFSDPDGVHSIPIHPPNISWKVIQHHPAIAGSPGFPSRPGLCVPKLLHQLGLGSFGGKNCSWTA